MDLPHPNGEYRFLNGAWVHETARLAEGVVLGPGAVIDADVELGRECRVGPHAVIHGPTVLGKENYLHSSVVLGGDPQDMSFSGGSSRLEIGDRNVFREFVTVSRGSPKGTGATRIGNGNYFMAGAHVGHDTIVEDDCSFANAALVAGHCYIGSGVNFSGGSAIVQFSTVGRLAFLGGLAGARQDLEPFLIHDRHTGDSLAQPHGVNRVGLRRADFSESAIDSLKTAYRILFVRKLKNELEEARAEIKRRGALSSEVEELLDFLHRKRSGRHGRQLQP